MISPFSSRGISVASGFSFGSGKQGCDDVAAQAEEEPGRKRCQPPADQHYRPRQRRPDPLRRQRGGRRRRRHRDRAQILRPRRSIAGARFRSQ
ncbi:hypothetical protein U1Q18_029687 [Sarracenia purpurea var. burkii]